MLTTYLRAAGCDDALLDDIWQESMLVAWRKLDEFDRSKPFGPWLRGIAARTLMASRRVASRFVLTSDVEALGSPLRSGTKDDVIDSGRIDSGPVDRGADDMCGERRRVGVVERAASSLGNGGSSGRYDGSFTHETGFPDLSAEKS